MIKLPIINSILNGDLRPELISTALPTDDLFHAHKALEGITPSSMRLKIELALINAVGQLVPVEDEYNRFISRIAAAPQVLALLNTQPDEATILSPGMFINDIFDQPPTNTLQLMFYQQIVELECGRTLWAFDELHQAFCNNNHTLAELSNTLYRIRHHCAQAKRDLLEHPHVKQLVQQALMHLHISLMLNYNCLYDSESRFTKTDFEYMVSKQFDRLPTEDEYKRFEDLVPTQPQTQPQPQPTATESSTPAESVNTDKVSNFLKAVEKFNFMQMDKIAALKSDEKVLALLAIALENVGHACAMLEYLGFYNHIQKQTVRNYTRGEYDKEMSKIFDLHGSSFKNYRVISAVQKNHSSQYEEKCPIEYQNILNS